MRLKWSRNLINCPSTQEMAKFWIALCHSEICYQDSLSHFPIVFLLVKSSPKDCYLSVPIVSYCNILYITKF